MTALNLRITILQLYFPVLSTDFELIIKWKVCIIFQLSYRHYEFQEQRSCDDVAFLHKPFLTVPMKVFLLYSTSQQPLTDEYRS